MGKLEFKFDENSFNKLYPFYILISKDLKIIGLGKSMKKVCKDLKLNSNFNDNFSIRRPHLDAFNFESVNELIDQLSVVDYTKDRLVLRGQFQFLQDAILFVGSPWFVSMDQIRSKNLVFNDFSISDPLLDLLHILNNQELTTKELNESLVTISKQKNKIKERQEELNRLSLVASTNQSGVVFTKPDGKIFWCNDAYLKHTGYSIDEIIGKTPIELGRCEATDNAQLHKMIQPFFKGEPFSLQLVHGRKDGSYFWTRTRGQAIKDENGKFIEYFAIVDDISTEVEARTKIVESENRLSTLIKNLETGILLEDQNRKILLSNKKFCSLFSIDANPDQLVGQDCSKSAEESKFFFNEPDNFVKRIAKILAEKKIVQNEILSLVDGRYFERSYIPIYEEGVYKGHLWTYTDVTLKVRYNESLEKEKQKYSSIIANMNLGLLEVNLDDEVTFANQAFCDISGFALEDLLGNKASGKFLDEESRALLEDKNKLREDGVSDSYEVKVTTKQGKKKTWLISGAPNYDLKGEPIGSIGIHLDITEQKEQEEELFLLSLIAEKNINAVIICNRNGEIEWVNKSFITMSGYTKEELIGKKPGCLLQGKNTSLETINYLKEQIRKGLPFNCEVLNYSKNGGEYWVSVQGQALYNKKGEILKYFAIEENITQRKLLEIQREELVTSLARINQELEDYAQIVSHDLKSPLRSIHSLISWIKEDNDKEFSEQTLQYLSMIESKVEKMDHLIHGILTYAKIDKVDEVIEAISINDIVKNIIEMIDIPENIQVIIKNELPTIEADKFRMQQLFQNIISNAVNYIDKEEGLVEVDFFEKEHSYVFSIKDNGPGIALENQEKMFNTFQSFTNSEKSTGLGLSIVKKVIETYKGKIWLESELKVGTTFFIKLKKQQQ
ncbi:MULTISPECIES: PAS domain S-box protein [Flavobacterium]|uniref:PAS domain S-box protein n=1 Tax=Flavobacterium jumunjinense TaxID=998845 RepID=A0ABV5GLD5_9FLAO|nr:MULTISPECIES: PAS domain S-box protein [Flavobacterium]